MMRTIRGVLALAVVVSAFSGAAHAQSVRNGGLSGTIVSASSIVPPAGRVDVDLLGSLPTNERGGNKHLIITQICVTAQAEAANGRGFTRVAGDGWNIEFAGTGELECERFEPGLPVLPPGRGTVACLAVGAGGAECTIVGVLSAK